ncbi:MAG: BlaI/MecI/CopY family transcriptional regulator [Fimbriimonadaceae bacterium]|nr:BlaI/MecI/CopY family transcriptional regulator [Fimbriimonadaceae bacterium]
MSKSLHPEEAPTGAQMDLLKIVAKSKEGMTAVEVWQHIQTQRPLARTTVITLLQRLQERGWLSKEGEGRGAIYHSLYQPEDATTAIVDGFLGRYFGGSPAKMMMNLLGSGKLSNDEISRLRKLLDEAEEEK